MNLYGEDVKFRSVQNSQKVGLRRRDVDGDVQNVEGKEKLVADDVLKLLEARVWAGGPCV